jgi:hypothetical protein
LTIIQSICDFAFREKGVRWWVYQRTIAIGFLYGVLNDALLHRPTQSVTREMACIMVTLSLSGAMFRRFGGKMHQNQRFAEGTDRRPPDSTSTRSRYILLLVVAVLTLAINMIPYQHLESAAVDRRLSQAISPQNLDLDRAKSLLHSAQVLKLPARPTALSNAASTLLQASEASQLPQHSVWETIRELLNYQSSISTAGAVVERVNSEARALGVAKPVYGVLLWKDQFSGEITLTSVGAMGRMRQTEGTSVPASISAILDPIGSPAAERPNEGAAYIIVGWRTTALGEAHIIVPIDGLRCRNIVFRGCKIIYNGGPVILENVAFENCSFDVQDNADTARFVARYVGSRAVTFSSDQGAAIGRPAGF